MSSAHEQSEAPADAGLDGVKEDPLLPTYDEDGGGWSDMPSAPPKPPLGAAKPDNNESASSGGGSGWGGGDGAAEDTSTVVRQKGRGVERLANEQLSLGFANELVCTTPLTPDKPEGVTKIKVELKGGCAMAGAPGVVVTCGLDRRVMVWELVSDQQNQDSSQQTKSALHAKAAAAETEAAAAASMRYVCTAALSGHSDWVHAVSAAATTDESMVVSGGRDGNIKVWKAKGSMRAGGAWKQAHTVDRAHAGGFVDVVELSPCGSSSLPQWCLTGGDDGQIKVWDTQGWQCECTLGGLDYGVASAAWVESGDDAGYVPFFH